VHHPEEHPVASTSPHPKAEIGRRVTISYAGNPAHPGVITGTGTAAGGGPLVRVRLDGQRSSLVIPADHEGLRYLAQVGPVPQLPMGRFQPSTQHPGFDYEHRGVLVVEFDDGDMAAIAADRNEAEVAIAAYLREQCGIDDEAAVRDELAELKPQWAVFEWEPEDAECAWLMHTAAEDDDQALRVHYLPTA
jgi:hypothetical protein